MQEKIERITYLSKNARKKILKISIALVVIFSILVVLISSSTFYKPVMLEKPEPVKATFPKINVNNYSYTVSVDKPVDALQSISKMAEVNDKAGTELTIYNDNLALVKEKRELDLKKGLNLVKYKDIASQIDATSVMFEDKTFPDTFVVEQNYEYDLVSTDKILEKYLDKEITLAVEQGEESKEVRGKLLSYVGELVLETANGIESFKNVEKISFPHLPDGLLTKPTLVWKLYTEEEGNRETETAYLTSGLSWKANYVAKVGENDDIMDLKGWVTTTNNSGTAYPNSRLKLVAGDVHRVYDYAPYARKGAYDMATEAIYQEEQFAEEKLFEYHMYSLERETNINNNETKQISLMASENVPVKKQYLFTGGKVQVKLKFENSEEKGLGVPLPKGVVRVYKEDSEGQLQFVGEDEIDHTPKDEERELLLGNAFDVTGKRTQTEATNVSEGVWRYSYEIELKNHKDEEIEINVEEYVGSSNRIVTNSHGYEKKDANTILFKVKVPANGTIKVTYTVENITYYAS